MKTNKKRAIIVPMLFATMLMFTACSSTEKPTANASAPLASTSPTVAPSETPAESLEPQPTSNTNINVKPVSVSSATTNVSKQIKDMFELAKLGKVAGLPFTAETGFFGDVEKAWGNADHKEVVGVGIYATYSKKNAVIGFNKGDQIIDIRSSDPKLQSITLNQIEQALGKPVDTKENGDDLIYIYQASSMFQLKFIIPKSSGKVDHISVFDTKHLVNNMAR